VLANKIFVPLHHRHSRCLIPLCMIQMMIIAKLLEINQRETSKDQEDIVKWILWLMFLQLQRKLMKVKSLKHMLKLFPS